MMVARKYTLNQLRSAWGAGVYHGQQAALELEVIDYEQEFKKLIEIEPRLKGVEDLARSFRIVWDNWPNDNLRNWPRPNGEYFWYHVVKQQMFDLVGTSRMKDAPGISESKHYDVAYKYLVSIVWPQGG